MFQNERAAGNQSEVRIGYKKGKEKSMAGRVELKKVVERSEERRVRKEC